MKMPSVGGARTFEQAEALARKLAGETVDPAELAQCDLIEQGAPSFAFDGPVPTFTGPDAPAQES